MNNLEICKKVSLETNALFKRKSLDKLSHFVGVLNSYFKLRLVLNLKISCIIIIIINNQNHKRDM